MGKFLYIAMLVLLAPASGGAAGTDALEPARAAIRTKEYAQAVAILTPAAHAGSADAQFLLASLQRLGLGTAPDALAARKLLIAAAEQQHAAAAYALAAVLANEAPRDPAEARRWLQRAAAAGHPLAQAAVARGALPLQFMPQLDSSDAGRRRAAFWVAVQQDDAALVAALADRELLSATDEFGRGPLAYAAARGAANALERLLALGAKVNQADSFGTTPLMLAAAHAGLESVDRLLQAQADADASDRVGNTALMYAALREPANAALVERLLRATARPGVTNAQGWSALDWALAADAQEVAALLRDRGLPARPLAPIVRDAPHVPLRRASVDLYRNWSDVEIAAARTSSGLFDAVRRERPEAPVPGTSLHAATIAESQALPHVLDAAVLRADLRQQVAALRWAIQHATPETVRAFVNRRTGLQPASDSEAPLATAVRARRIEIVKVLLDAQVDVNAVDHDGKTALMLAAATGQAAIVAELLGHLARVDSVDRAARTALWYATAAGDEASVAALVAARGQVSQPDAAGLTPLAVAAAGGHARIVTSLLKAGAGQSPQGASRLTPLMLAARNGDSETIRLLAGTGASIDAQNRNGDTALIVAVRHAHADAVRTLLAAGASTKIRNSDRASAADVAKALGLADLEGVLAQR